MFESVKSSASGLAGCRIHSAWGLAADASVISGLHKTVFLEFGLYMARVLEACDREAGSVLGAGHSLRVVTP